MRTIEIGIQVALLAVSGLLSYHYDGIDDMKALLWFLSAMYFAICIKIDMKK